MGLDVLSVRCHSHNTSHSALSMCPLCERERGARHAAERLERERELERERAAAVQRHGPMCGCPLCERPAAAVPPAQTCQCFRCKGGAPATCRELPPVLQLEPGAELEPSHVQPSHVQAAIDRLSPHELAQLLSDRELWRIRQNSRTQLHRVELRPVCVAAGATTSMEVQPCEPMRVVRLDFSADEGARALELVRVGRVWVGTRTIGEGGTLAQLNRCPLAREVIQPGGGAGVWLENFSASCVTLRGVAVCERLVRPAIEGDFYRG